VIDRLVANEDIIRELSHKKSGQFSSKDIAAGVFTQAVSRLSILDYCRLIVRIGATRNLFTAIFYLIFHVSAWRTTANVEKWAAKAARLMCGMPNKPDASEIPSIPSSSVGSTPKDNIQSGDTAEGNAGIRREGLEHEDGEVVARRLRATYQGQGLGLRGAQNGQGGGAVQGSGRQASGGTSPKTPPVDGKGNDIAQTNGSQNGSSGSAPLKRGVDAPVTADPPSPGEQLEGSPSSPISKLGQLGESPNREEVEEHRRASALNDAKRRLQVENGPFQELLIAAGVADVEENFYFDKSSKCVISESKLKNANAAIRGRLSRGHTKKPSAVLISMILSKAINDSSFSLPKVSEKDSPASYLIKACSSVNLVYEFTNSVNTSFSGRFAALLLLSERMALVRGLYGALEAAITVARAAANGREKLLPSLTKDWHNVCSKPRLAAGNVGTLTTEGIVSIKQISDARGLLSFLNARNGFSMFIAKMKIDDTMEAKRARRNGKKPSVSVLHSILEQAMTNPGFRLPESPKCSDPIEMLNNIAGHVGMKHTFKQVDQSSSGAWDRTKFLWENTTTGLHATIERGALTSWGEVHSDNLRKALQCAVDIAKLAARDWDNDSQIRELCSRWFTVLGLL
jgi:hypothetical protein